ncbi:ABC transporter ATP-binding protein [Winogradskya humida]|uniref:ABC transporter ATP-binding protein n=1 Tax=Winogradskya humida TaxID=113566 RepID=A0ABQ4A5L9_9ACTN|nr:ABC transporter ATP-binding protein [Actinoplanes humidus]GIE26131.1 ABC transporter ATP-binding protein [Actinoplanes humidus]
MSAVIEVQHLNKSFGDLVAVEDVSFTVEEGEIFGIVGPRGSGKTTIVECLEGLRAHDSGSIQVLGRDPRQERAEVTRRIADRLQDGRLPDRLAVAEALTLYGSFYRDPADWRELMAALGLTTSSRTREGAGTSSSRHRLSVAFADVGRPQVAVLDGLTTGQDPRSRRETWAAVESVRASGVTILLVTPFRAEAEQLCDRVALMDRGRLTVTGPPAR